MRERSNRRRKVHDRVQTRRGLEVVEDMAAMVRIPAEKAILTARDLSHAEPNAPACNRDATEGVDSSATEAA